LKNESVTNCYQLKLPAADGKKRLTDMADLQGISRIIQSIPSKKAEPVKQWLAQLGEQRIDQMIDPELTFQMAVEDYRRQGYSDIFLNFCRFLTGLESDLPPCLLRLASDLPPITYLQNT